VFDVGAHAGRFSMFIERLPGFEGNIYAFEPVPQTYSMLRDNLRLNNSKRVRAAQCAVCDRPARVTMNLFPPEFSSWNSMGRPLMTAPNGKKVSPSATVDVPAISIDSFCYENNIETIHFLKVDVEGFEKSVFEGARRMLAEHKIHRICFEISRDPLKGAGVQAGDVFQVLESFGYTIYRFDPARQKFAGPVHDSNEYWMNYFASFEPLPDAIVEPTSAAA